MLGSCSTKAPTQLEADSGALCRTDSKVSMFIPSQYHGVLAAVAVAPKSRATWVRAFKSMVWAVLQGALAEGGGPQARLGQATNIFIHHLYRPDELSIKLVELIQDMFGDAFGQTCTITWQLCSRRDMSCIVMPTFDEA